MANSLAPPYALDCCRSRAENPYGRPESQGSLPRPRTRRNLHLACRIAQTGRSGFLAVTILPATVIDLARAGRLVHDRSEGGQERPMPLMYVKVAVVPVDRLSPAELPEMGSGCSSWRSGAPPRAPHRRAPKPYGQGLRALTGRYIDAAWVPMERVSARRWNGIVCRDRLPLSQHQF